MSEPQEPGPEPESRPDDADAELAAARAKAAALDERLDKLEDEALPKLTHPASVGGMIGT